MTDKRKEQSEHLSAEELKEVDWIHPIHYDEDYCSVCGEPDDWWNGHILYKHDKCDEIRDKYFKEAIDYKNFIKNKTEFKLANEV
jgi:hypothetical protein